MTSSVERKENMVEGFGSWRDIRVHLPTRTIGGRGWVPTKKAAFRTVNGTDELAARGACALQLPRCLVDVPEKDAVLLLEQPMHVVFDR